MIAVLRTFVLLFSLSIALALPSNLAKSPLAIEAVNRTAQAANSTPPNPVQEYDISCLQSRIAPTLYPPDCGYILNVMIISEPNIFHERRFQHNSYQTDDGNRVPSRWQFLTCELSVFGQRHAHTQLTLYDVALTANRIVQQCVDGQAEPKGGLSLIGDSSNGFHVILQANPRVDSAKNSTVSQGPAVGVSRRTMQSRHDSDTTARSRGLVTTDPLADASRVSNRGLVTSNFSLSVTAVPNYPVYCFNPFVIHLQPAAAEDCSFIINQIILRLFDPTRQLTFGFTDAADINLSKRQYRTWQYRQCAISLKNNHEDQIDTFTLLNVANTARRIVSQCLVYQVVRIGGVANIGTDGRGFYVYVGGPLASNPAMSGAMLLPESAGVESS